ncbi:Arb2 domain-containing protein [Boeremia exigua]|uniref:Arb2 domain-containing protein n=1 Tax=Boeremia exigua TaxID=749465 RepID=UPI001E8D6351|nr:Arb2 domain-containing protein [Boeremia exigua]KAH6619954.1 Arb2 domain-containing protein [Boeremia exigua]
MFRRKGDTISPDASYPANLKELGFFINKLGHIRMIEAPDKPFVFNATNIERHNEVRNEALHACSRAEVTERASKLGIKQLFFPQLTTVKPAGPHIPILAPSADILRTRKRIVVIINDTLQDLGILAYRQLQRDLGFNGGSVINFAKEMVKRSARNDKEGPIQSIFDDGVSIDDSETPGLVVLNAGQLLYSHKFNRSMTLRSWYALPRKSIAHDAIRIHEEENYVEGHRTPAQHIKSVFDQLLCNPEYVSPDADLYIVAIEDGASNALEVINDDFDKYGTRIAAMAMIHTLAEISDLTHPSLKAFLHQRTRQWKYSDLGLDPEECTELPDDYSCDAPKQTLQQDTNVIRWNAELPGPSSLSEIATPLHRLTLNTVFSSSDKSAPTNSDPDASYDWGSGSVPCPTFAGGQEPAGECVFTDPAVQRAILSFFEDVAQDPENYRNPAFTTVVVPSPTADEPFILDADAPVPETVDTSTAHLMTPEQLELDEARKKLADMRIALGACPDDVDILAKGREKLAAKVAKQEAAIQDLQVKALGSGALGAGEAEDLRQEWKPQVDGPRVPFAGTMVDSELLKAAGLGETASEELEKLGEGKAFL